MTTARITANDILANTTDDRVTPELASFFACAYSRSADRAEFKRARAGLIDCAAHAGRDRDAAGIAWNVALRTGLKVARRAR